MRSILDGEGRKHLAYAAADSWTVLQALQVLAWLSGRSIRLTELVNADLLTGWHDRSRRGTTTCSTRPTMY